MYLITDPYAVVRGWLSQAVGTLQEENYLLCHKQAQLTLAANYMACAEHLSTSGQGLLESRKEQNCRNQVPRTAEGPERLILPKSNVPYTKVPRVLENGVRSNQVERYSKVTVLLRISFMWEFRCQVDSNKNSIRSTYHSVSVPCHYKKLIQWLQLQ